ncbi:hypothetical protein ACLOJK_025339 [Asimina triloba]
MEDPSGGVLVCRVDEILSRSGPLVGTSGVEAHRQEIAFQRLTNFFGGNYLQWFETKAKFFELCRKRGLPHPSQLTLASMSMGATFGALALPV